jgi:hypothetical protein
LSFIFLPGQPLSCGCKSVLFVLHSVNIDIDCVNLKSRSLFDCVSDFVDDALAYGGYVDSVGHDYVQVNNKTLAVLAHGDALVGEMTVLFKDGTQTLAHIAVGHARNSEARGGGIADEGREIGLRYLDNAEMIFKSYQGKSSLQK